jgi:hypothetical protein
LTTQKKPTSEEQRALDILSEAARKLAETRAYHIPDGNGSTFLNRQKLKEDVLRGVVYTSISIIIVGFLSWGGSNLFSMAMKDREEILYKQDLALKGIVVIMQGAKIGEINDNRMKLRINDNTKMIYRDRKIPCPDNIELETYWSGVRIEDFIPKDISNK